MKEPRKKMIYIAFGGGDFEHKRYELGHVVRNALMTKRHLLCFSTLMYC